MPFSERQRELNKFSGIKTTSERYFRGLEASKSMCDGVFMIARMKLIKANQSRIISKFEQ